MGTEKTEWTTSDKYRGVRYREHASRRHGVRPDRYFMIRFQVGGKRREEALGWASEGWSEQRAFLEMTKLKEAAKTGEGPSSLAEKRAAVEAKKQADEEAEAARRRAEITVTDFFGQTYFPFQRSEMKAGQKAARSVQREDELFRRWIEPVIGGKPIKDITSFDLERVKKNMLDAGRAPRTALYCLAVVRQIVNHARKDGIFCGENPVAHVRKPSADNRRDGFLTHEQADRLLEALGKKSRQVHDMALLSLHCGLRAGEIFSLTWGDVDIERGMLSIRDTKSGKNRVAFMTEAVKAMFADREREGHNDLVFPSETGEKIGQISQCFIKTVNALGLNDGVTDRRQKIVFHSLRHTFASWLVEQGIDLFAVQKLMGHESQAMVQRYAHFAPDHLQAAVKTLEAGMDAAKLAEKKKVVEMRP